MALALYEHNQKAYHSALAMMEEAGRAAVIHPTGTGKSFLAFKLAEDHPQDRIVWLSPSRYLAAQQCENRRKSDPHGRTDNITFLTYARLMANRDRLSQIPADYIILDEFHRCGAAEWGKGVKALLESHQEAKVLGLSATKLRYLDEQRDMAEELFAGNVASEMTLAQAIARGILPAPRYVISLYSVEEEGEKYQKKVQAIREEGRRKEAERILFHLRRALKQAGGLETIFQKYLRPNGKYIVFCSGVKHLEEMKSHATEWFSPVKERYQIYTVFAENGESEKEFQAFKEDRRAHLKLLFCIDMLNEGIHLEDVDGVILMRPTVSPVIYWQQIGRALTAGRRKPGIDADENGPLILDLVNNFENLRSIDAIEREWEEAWGSKILRSESLEEDGLPPGAFQILDETRNAWKLFSQLQEKLRVSWEEYYQDAKTYYAETGNLEIPAGYESPSGLALGRWLFTQRRIYMGKIPGHLEPEQIEKLEKLGIQWESDSDRQWERYYRQAARYYARTGNLDVKLSYVTEEGFRLGIWLNNLRQYRQNKSRALDSQRQKQLEQIGMIWDKLSYKWERGYEAARQYRDKHGDLEVPAGYVTENGFHLGTWLSAQRQNRKGKKKGALPLTKEQIARLDGLGINWGGKHRERWEQYFAAARRYAETNGGLDMPYSYETEDGLALGRWLYQQRLALGEKEVSEWSERETGRRARLSALGMRWEKDPWWEKWELARQYYEEQGNLNMPQSYVTKEGVWLGKWLYLQRERHRKKEKGRQLTEKQTAALDAIGMDWLTPNERAWENGFVRARAFYQKWGNLEVEKGYAAEDGFRLDLWLNRQRKCRREGKKQVLTPERVARLEEIGMRW